MGDRRPRDSNKRTLISKTSRWPFFSVYISTTALLEASCTTHSHGYDSVYLHAVSVKLSFSFLTFRLFGLITQHHNLFEFSPRVGCRCLASSTHQFPPRESINFMLFFLIFFISFSSFFLFLFFTENGSFPALWLSVSFPAFFCPLCTCHCGAPSSRACCCGRPISLIKIRRKLASAGCRIGALQVWVATSAAGSTLQGPVSPKHSPRGGYLSELER